MKVYLFYTMLAGVFLCTACTVTPDAQDIAGSVVPVDSLKSEIPQESGGNITRKLWADLQKMEWHLAQVHVGRTEARSDEKTYNLSFTKSHFSARFCNQVAGEYVLLPESRVRFEKVFSTEMFCGSPAYLMIAEGFVKDGIYGIDITKGYLTLARDGNSLVFTRKSTPEENPMAD
ncbi:MAG: META domain-containing protein [Bacteroidia bacterium]|nr:META domain-containing protein [Bacteroidia bacterium]